MGQDQFKHSKAWLIEESQDTAESEEAVDIDEADDESEEETMSLSV